VDHDFLYLPDILVDYRIWEGQMSHRTGERLDNAFRLMRRFLADHPGCVTAADRRRAWAHTYVSRGRWRMRQGERAAGARDWLAAFANRPWDRRLWSSVANLMLVVNRDDPARVTSPPRTWYNQGSHVIRILERRRGRQR